MALPPGAYTIKSAMPGNEKYLLYMGDNNLQFSGDDGTDPNAKFQVEENKDRSGLRNIKSSNGKYWMRQDEGSYRIKNIANRANEDQSLWSCTLFKIEKESDDKYRILHVQSGNFIEPKPEDHFNSYASQGTTNTNQIVEVNAI